MYRQFLVALLLGVVVSSAAAQSFARAKIVHAYYGFTGKVNVTISIDSFEVQQIFNLPYKGASDWFYLPYDTYDYEVAAQGQVLLSGSSSFSSPSVIFCIAETKALALRNFEDNLDSVARGKAHLSFLNYVANQANNLDIGYGQSFSGLIKDLSSDFLSTPIPIDAGGITIDARVTGETGNPLFSFSGDFESGKHYLVLAVGNNNGNPAPEFTVVELADWSIDARLSFIQGWPIELLVNVTIIDGFTVFKDLSFKNITEYKNIPVGSHRISVGNGDNVAIIIDAFFNGFTEYSMYANIAAAPAGVLLMDSNQAPDEGSARLRFLHSASADPIDIRTAGNQLVEGVPYGLSSEYLSLSAGSYPISLREFGVSSPFFEVNLTVPSDRVITIVAIGSPQGTGEDEFTLLTVNHATYGTKGHLRGVHAVAGSPTVNIKADGTQVFSGVAYKDVSDYLLVDPGLYRVSVHKASDDSELFRSPIRVDAAGYFTAIAGGFEAGFDVFQIRDDNTRPAPTTAHLRVVHASASSTEVSIEFAGSVVGALSYTEVFGYIPVPAGAYVARVLAGSDAVFNGSITLEADTVVSVFAVGVVGDTDTAFTVLPAIDFDYRTPVAPPTADSPVATPVAPTTSPVATLTPRTSSGAIASVSVVLVGLVALL